MKVRDVMKACSVQMLKVMHSKIRCHIHSHTAISSSALKTISNDRLITHYLNQLVVGQILCLRFYSTPAMTLGTLWVNLYHKTLGS